MVDASLRATILETLRALNHDLGIAILYITHDLTTAYQVADNIMIMYRGHVVEAGDVEHVINDPKHPYTRLLVQSIPMPDPSRRWADMRGANDPPFTGIDVTPTMCPFVKPLPRRNFKLRRGSPEHLRAGRAPHLEMLPLSGCWDCVGRKHRIVFQPPRRVAINQRHRFLIVLS